MFFFSPYKTNVVPKTNVATDKGKDRNEIRTLMNEIRVAIQSWL